jgi:thiol:disulfide interchange protein DsbD
VNTKIKYLAILLMLICITGLLAKAAVKISVTPDSLKAGEQGKIKAVISIPANMHQSYFPGDEEYFYLKAVGKGLSFSKTQYPAPQKKEEGNEWIYSGTITLVLPFTVKKDAPAGKITIDAEVGYNICLDTGACEAPESVNKTLNFNIIGITNPDTPVSSDETVISDSAAAGTADDTAEPVTESSSGSANVWKFLLMAFLGGVILNIMPCVLPVLSIKAMSIVKQAHEDKKVIMKHSFAYTGGILVSFLILASVIIALKLAGESVGWGFQFQNTAFVMVLTSMIFVFALSLFDVFIITPPGMNKATQASAKGGFGGSFFSGIFAVLLATPCSAPMLGTALGFAFAQPPLLILFFFLLIGLGLALPFILLGFNPKLMKVIPKPGEWMNIFKEVMGFLLLGTTVWLLHVVYQQNGGGYLLNVLIYLVFLGFATWLYGRFVRLEHSRFTQWLFTILAVVIIFASVWFFLPYNDTTAQQNTENTVNEQGFEGWLKFSPTLVEELLAKEQPVFIDFGAKWCMTCLSNEKTVIKTDEMKAAFAEKKVTLVRGDFTKKNPEMQEFMKKFGRAGVPFYVLYVPGKEPVLFPEIITVSMVKKALEQLP